jgi:cystathionine gamma-synthase
MSKEGYHGTHGAIELYTRNRNVQFEWIEEMKESRLSHLPTHTLLWLESPQNPRGEVADLQYYRNLLPKHVNIAVDATFAPPPIQNLLSNGADYVMHSSTKFLGGHSDLLGGVLMTKSEEEFKKLSTDRASLGAVMGNMEAWLLLRSLRTLTVRVVQQSNNASFLANWLDSKSEPCLDIVAKVWHASLPDHPGHEACKRQGSGWSGVLAIEFVSLHHARLICSNLEYFDNATSLGGCESLIEWRAAVDPKISPSLCRLNIGLEDVEDLQLDLRKGFLIVAKLVEEFSKRDKGH